MFFSGIVWTNRSQFGQHTVISADINCIKAANHHHRHRRQLTGAQLIFYGPDSFSDHLWLDAHAHTQCIKYEISKNSTMTHWRKNQIKGPSASPPPPTSYPFCCTYSYIYNTQFGGVRDLSALGRDVRDVCDQLAAGLTHTQLARGFVAPY